MTLQLPTPALLNLPGVYFITAVSSGDANYAASFSAPGVVTILGTPTSTGTAGSVADLAATAHTLIVGQSESLIVTVAPADGMTVSATTLTVK